MSSDRHHRKPRSLGGKSRGHNFVRVDEKRHHIWHMLFDNWSGDKIARELNTMWLDPDYLVVHRSALKPGKVREMVGYLGIEDLKSRGTRDKHPTDPQITG